MKKVSVLILLVALSGLLALAEEINVTGNWTMTITTQRGDRSNEVTFTQEGEKLKVTMKSPRGDITGEGTVRVTRLNGPLREILLGVSSPLPTKAKSRTRII